MQPTHPSSHPPLQPSYILRGHSAQIHSVHFLRQNSRLLTGDADGWVVLWDVAARRPRAVWKPHEGGVLRVADWKEERVVSHGRDNKLHVWQLRASDEKDLSTLLPLEDLETLRRQPWLLHSLTVNALNFCGFAMCDDVRQSAAPRDPGAGRKDGRREDVAEVTRKNAFGQGNKVGGLSALLAGQDEASGSESVVARTEPTSTTQECASISSDGDTMAGNQDGNRTRPEQSKGILIAVPGFNDGQIAIWSLPSSERIATIDTPTGVKTGMVMALHLLHHAGSLHLLAGYESGHTSIFRATPSHSSTWQTIYTQKCHTQPILSLFPSPSHGVYFTSGADSIIAQHPLSSTSPSSAEAKTVATKHAGQQSLHVRSDARIFATAGWDGRVRVYVAKTCEEVAVLRWHREGCYALAFADVGPASHSHSETRNGGAAGGTSSSAVGGSQGKGDSGAGGEGDENDGRGEGVVRRGTADRVAVRREQRARSTHWLAAGSKDGKVSLWDIY